MAQLCSGKISSLWVLAAYYAFVLFSPIVSAFYYNSDLSRYSSEH